MLQGSCDVIVVYSHFTLKKLQLTRIWTYTGSMLRCQPPLVFLVSRCSSQCGPKVWMMSDESYGGSYNRQDVGSTVY